MANATFYHPDLDINDSQVELSEIESAHAIKSRRLREGSPVNLINGRGLMAKGSIAQADKRSVTVQIDSYQQSKQVRSVSIATAIPKGDRQRTMIDMLTQLGLGGLFPLNCEHSVTRFRPSMHDKWQRWAIEACKQSQNPWLPEIHQQITLDHALALADFTIVYADSSGSDLVSLESNTDKKELLILIGPEGGFSEKEKQRLDDSGCAAIKLGHTILRTELAAITALAQAFMKDN